MLTYSYTKKYSNSNTGMVSFYAVLIHFLHCSVVMWLRIKELVHQGLEITFGEWLSLHQTPAGTYHMLGTTTKLSNAVSSSRVVVTLERNILFRLGSYYN